jgi:hypothetical protein
MAIFQVEFFLKPSALPLIGEQSIILDFIGKLKAARPIWPR